MKKIKVILAAFAFTVATVFAFAFNKNEVEPEAELKIELQTYWYGNNGDGTYRLLAGSPTGDCLIPDPNPCVIWSSEELPDGFAIEDKPADAQESTELSVHTD